MHLAPSYGKGRAVGEAIIEQLAAKREEDVFNIEAQYSEKISKLTKGDELRSE